MGVPDSHRDFVAEAAAEELTLEIAARRLALYADTCAALLRGAGYPGRAGSLEAKGADVLRLLKDRA